MAEARRKTTIEERMEIVQNTVSLQKRLQLQQRVYMMFQTARSIPGVKKMMLTGKMVCQTSVVITKQTVKLMS